MKVVEVVLDGDLDAAPATAAAPRRTRAKAAAGTPVTPATRRKKAGSGPSVSSADEVSEDDLEAEEEELEDVDVAEIEDITVELETVELEDDEETPSIVEALSGSTEKAVAFIRDGDDVVLTVGGKKRGLEDVDDLWRDLERALTSL